MTAQPRQSTFRAKRFFRWGNVRPQPAVPRPERRDCQGRLVTQLLTALGEGWTLTEASFGPWCSATFIGAQHHVVLGNDRNDPIDRALAEARHLPDREFRIAGHIVADVAVDDVREIAPGVAQITLTILTVEDW